MKVIESIEALLAIVNLENRVGPWKDVNDAVRRLQSEYARMKAEGVRLAYRGPQTVAKPFVITGDEECLPARGRNDSPTRLRGQ